MGATVATKRSSTRKAGPLTLPPKSGNFRLNRQKYNKSQRAGPVSLGRSVPTYPCWTAIGNGAVLEI